MTIRMDALIRVFAQALDMVEAACLGVSTNHGKRIAVLCAATGRKLGMNEPEISDLVTCALLHDNALTEYILLQQGRERDGENFRTHCVMGQRNIETLPFNGIITGNILFHHEQADGKGPFEMPEGTCPLGAELIAATDMIDAELHLQRFSPEELPKLRGIIEADIHRRVTARAGNVLLEALDLDLLESLRDERIAQTVGSVIPEWNMRLDDPSLVSVAEFIAHIIDCKSAFTKAHTQQIARRAWFMAEHYGYDTNEKIQLYLAAALHDIGKLAVPSEVLEKPGRLTNEEFNVIKTHVGHTRSLLSAMDGLGIIVEWASNHHETLDGSGYPLGKNEAELDFNSRLMACIDIYQAVCEERPYHPRRSHEETMPILRQMAEAGKIDASIVKDLDTMAAWSEKDMDASRRWG